MKKLFSWVTAVVLAASATQAAPPPLTGLVVDARTGAPVAGANLRIGPQQVATDTLGAFHLPRPDGTADLLEVTHVAYHEYRKRLGRDTGIDLLIRLEPRPVPLAETVVTAGRAVDGETPIAFSELSGEQLRARQGVQETPLLLTELPNVYAYADAGNGVGYSYLKIRGFDQKRIGVMVNGIPQNDPEDHQVYWVDLPDLLASVESLQVQRGVSHSLYGVGAFGGTVNLVTSARAERQGLRVTAGTGSFGTRRLSVAMDSGPADSTYAVHARFSRLVSDGYRRRSGVEQWAYFLGFEKRGARTNTRVNLYGGPELTHAAWDAVREDLLAVDRRTNPTSAGYDNTIDDFHQPHYELIHTWRPAPGWSVGNTLFVVQGEGYYEMLRQGRRLRDFGLPEIATPDPTLFGTDSLAYYETIGDSLLRRDAEGRYRLTKTDLVRQNWVEKRQVGWIGRIEKAHYRGRLTLGGEVSDYNGRHWGKVLWAAGLSGASSPEHTYYTYRSDQTTAALYLNELLAVTDRLRLMGEIQVQRKEYRLAHRPVGGFVGDERNAYTVRHTFVNPRVGAIWSASPGLELFTSLALAQREPADSDYYDTWESADDLGADPLFARSDTVRTAGRIERIEWRDPLVKPEQLLDAELGLGFRRGPHALRLNAYWMDLRHEIIAYGQVDDEGVPVRGNADRTVHRGLEASASLALLPSLEVTASGALSQNYYADYAYHTWNEEGEVVVLDYGGHTIPLFPGRLGSVRLTYRLGEASVEAQLQHAGLQQLDDSDDPARSIPGHTVLNLGLRTGLQRLGIPGMSAEVSLRNAADARYSTSGYYDPWEGARYLYPAAGRNYYLGITAAW
ncbi:MAG: TonB-dependent receptor [Candidatus Latescibacterota bacterium]|jgi:iron complex outermembrane receptor protein